MRTDRFSLWSAVAVLSLVASLTCGNRAHAQVTETLVLGGTYNNFGYTLDGQSYGGGGPIVPSTLGGVSVPWVYCIDIPDEVGVPATYTNTTVTTTGQAVYGNSAINTWANGNDLANVPNAGQIAWLLDHYGASANTGGALYQDALQSAIWTEIYGASFTITNDGSTNQTDIINYTAAYLTGVGTAPTSDVSWLSPGGAGTGAIYQALVTSDAPTLPSPEPSTLIIAGLGALGFLGYGWKRRKSS